MPQNSDGEILVVDDDALTRKILVRTLTAAGYQCGESESGLAAWDQVHRKQPSLLLLDLAMPDLSGAELLKRLRSDQNPDIAQIPAIMLTGHGDEDSEILCLEAGADDFVTKPIKSAVLQARIETQLRLRLMRRQLQQQNDELEAWRRNLERDLAAARLTQQSLIPNKLPKLRGWDMATCFRPVIQVGGDIYGWLKMKDGRLLFWIADATGHGASAALLTTLTTLLFHHSTAEHKGAGAIMQRVNSDFRSIFGGRTFMTAMCVALEPASGRATVIGAGHPPLLICRRAGAVELIESGVPPLGLIDQPIFLEKVVNLQVGDAFLLYTDGLFGDADAKRRRLTPEMLAKLIDPTASTAEVLLGGLLNQVAPSDSKTLLPDDLAVVAVRRTS
jgi:phosphoserine phosphatase RsbU/P